MEKDLSRPRFDRIVQGAAGKKFIHGAVFHAASGDGKIDCICASGNIQEEGRYYIASINKMVVSALILKMHTEKSLDLGDRIADYLANDEIAGLHVYRGTDYSENLTIAHLISNTSGLPCYLKDRQANGATAFHELEAGIDQEWPVPKVLAELKSMKAHFPPGQKGRAEYIDSNHQILSLVIERVTKQPMPRVINDLFRNLGMTDSYVFEDPSDTGFTPIWYNANVLNIPRYLASTRNDIISTAKDQMKFLRAFFAGYFYPYDRLFELERWNRIFPPFSYGTGIQKFSLPRILSPFHPVPDMIGHCGSTGALAFYVPTKDLYITGTVNQQARPDIAFQTMIRIVRAVR